MHPATRILESEYIRNVALTILNVKLNKTTKISYMLLVPHSLLAKMLN